MDRGVDRVQRWRRDGDPAREHRGGCRALTLPAEDWDEEPASSTAAATGNQRLTVMVTW